MLCLIAAVWTDLYTSGTSYYYMQSFNTYFRHKSNKWTKSFENRLGTFHCKNLMRHSTAFVASQVECQSTACMEIPRQEHWERCLAACWKILTSSLKSAPSHRGIWTPSHTWFLGLTWAHIPNSILIGSAIFAGFMVVTEQQTDRLTYHATPPVATDNVQLVLQWGLKIEKYIKHDKKQIPMQDEGDMALRSNFHRLSPELEFRFNGTVECVVRWVHMKCTHRWVMTNLLTDDSVSQTLATHDNAWPS